MLPRVLATVVGAGPPLLLFSPDLTAQSCSRTFGPMGPEMRPSQTLVNDQVSCAVARGANTWVIAWSDEQEVYSRRFDLQLAPLGPEFVVNTYFNQDVQDEPALSFGTTGNLICAWTDQHGYDGSGPGIMARIYDSSGASITSEFVVNSITSGSQGHPQIAPTPSGGWVVGWTGDNDGNAYFRILSANGVFLTGDVLVNTYTTGAQGGTSPAVHPNGTIFVAFVDYTSHGAAGTGANVYGRTFDSSGVPVQPQEFLITSGAAAGDQINPRACADALGRFWVVWEDQYGDGYGHGIYERVFDHNGVPYATEALVNTTVQGDQILPAIVLDSLGRSTVTWTDYSGGPTNPVIRARRFNGQGNAFGPDFVVNEFPAVGTVQATPAMDSTGEDIVIGYQGPGAQGNGIDVYARQFACTSGPHVYCAAKVNSQGCTPEIGFSGTPSASLSSPFTITGTNVINRKLGLMFYGYGSTFTPFQGSTICVQPPLKRMPAQNSGGSSSGTDCTGVLSTDFNARIQSGIDPGLVAGATISARWYYRDPHDPAGYGTGLTNALRFAICP